MSTCVAQVLLNRLAEVLGGVRLDKIFKAAEVRTDHGKVYAKSYEVPKGCVSIRKLKPRRVSEAQRQRMSEMGRERQREFRLAHELSVEDPIFADRYQRSSGRQPPWQTSGHCAENTRRRSG